MISVIINVYNGEDYIDRCLNSIINQTYSDLDILIVNDGSVDSTLDRCMSYNDSRIRIISTDNLGLSLSRNVGLDNALGDYLYFVDVDDYISSDTIEYLYNLCISYDCDIATCKCYDVYDGKIDTKKKKEKVSVLSNVDMLKKVLLSNNREVALWNKLFKKNVFDGLRFDDRIIDDLIFTYKIFFKDYRTVYSNQVKYYYSKDNTGITESTKNDLIRTQDTYKGLLERYDNIKKIYPNMIENDVSMMQDISKFYLRTDDIIKYMNDMKAYDFYKEIFSLKLFRCSLPFKGKVKLVFFRISPRFHEKMVDFYLKIMGKKRW